MQLLSMYKKLALVSFGSNNYSKKNLTKNIVTPMYAVEFNKW